jgi:hypothetical protein
VTILIALLNVLIMFLGPPIGISLIARKEARRFPGVKVTPQQLPDYTASDAPGTTLSYFGYSFEVPWNASFKQKAFGKGGLVQLEFESGQSVTFILPANQSGLLTEVVQDKSLHMENLELAFGDLMKRSPYDQYAALLNTTPLSIRAFGPRAEAVRGATLLTIKAIAAGPGLEQEYLPLNYQTSADFKSAIRRNQGAWTLKSLISEDATSRSSAQPRKTVLGCHNRNSIVSSKAFI